MLQFNHLKGKCYKANAAESETQASSDESAKTEQEDRYSSKKVRKWALGMHKQDYFCIVNVQDNMSLYV